MFGKRQEDQRTTMPRQQEESPGRQDESRELMLLGQAERALAEATSLEEIKVIRDKAEAARKYVESARLGLSMQNHAAEVKLRAERAAGELLAKMKLAGGDRRSNGAARQLRLEDLGLTKHQSSHWQRIAKVPIETFERFVQETLDGGEELTTAGVLRLARRFATSERPAVKKPEELKFQEGEHTGIESIVAGGERFACIYADPPWRYENETTRGAASKHYPTMSLEEIASMPVAEVVHENAHLHLWVTNDFLFEAPRIMQAWGFEYKSCLVWVKPQMGLGNYWRLGHEFLLLGVRGSLKFQDRGVISWIRANRTRHSPKPEKIRKLVERVSPGPYLELFGRKGVRGWTVMGDELDEQA